MLFSSCSRRCSKRLEILALVALSLMVDAWAIGPGLSAIRATATEVERLLDSLLARLGVEDDLPYRYPTIVAGVRVVLLFSGGWWVR